MEQRRPTMDQLASMRGNAVFASDGDQIGNLDVIYYDEATGEPEWIGISSGGFLGMGGKRVLVPVEGAQIQGGDKPSVNVPFPKDQVKNTPGIDSDEISEDTERQLYQHYGMQPSEMRSDTQLPETQPGQQRTGMERPTMPPEGQDREASVTRSEEELEVGKREVPRGRVRLRKWVETEPVSEQVRMRRETAHVEREPIDRPAPGAQIGEEEESVTLHGEEPVVSKETVEKERVSIEKGEETVDETVRGEVRKEHVDVEGESEDLDEGQGRRHAA